MENKLKIVFIPALVFFSASIFSNVTENSVSAVKKKNTSTQKLYRVFSGSSSSSQSKVDKLKNTTITGRTSSSVKQKKDYKSNVVSQVKKPRKTPDLITTPELPNKCDGSHVLYLSSNKRIKFTGFRCGLSFNSCRIRCQKWLRHRCYDHAQKTIMKYGHKVHIGFSELGRQCYLDCVCSSGGLTFRDAIIKKCKERNIKYLCGKKEVLEK